MTNFSNWMGNEKKTKKRGHALHDATHGQFGEEPRVEPSPKQKRSGDGFASGRRKVARKKSKSV